MEFIPGTPVFRDRKALVSAEHNPDRMVPGDWDPSLTIALPDAWLGPSSSIAVPDATRTQILTDLSLFSTDPTVDVRPGDRIRSGGTEDDFETGAPYMVEVIPDAPTNPFTGWQPYKEVPLVGPTG